MAVFSLRNALMGVVGCAALLGFAGCECTGGTPRGSFAKAPKKSKGDPAAPYYDDMMLLDRLDRLEMSMNSNFSRVDSNIDDLRRSRSVVSAPMVASSMPPPTVVVEPLPTVGNEPYVLPEPVPGATFVGWPQSMEPISASRPAPRAAPRNADLRAKHLRVPGVTVKQLQLALREAGCNPGKIDGSMGPNTVTAIKTFQRNTGLTPDGVVGPKTWAMLQTVTHQAGAPGKV